jgi:glycosyltransferase involved in cell wall biosynthesis
MKTVVVITPSIGKPELEQAINSVKRQQSSHMIRHLVVADGPHYYGEVYKIAAGQGFNTGTPLQLNMSPVNTGAMGFYGHRIYAAYSHLVDENYIVFLDEDNWFEPNHVQSLVDMCMINDLDFAHSLRKVYWQDKAWEDNCESIGRWPIWFTQDQHDDHQDYLVDTSSYCFERKWLIENAQLWHKGWGGDREFFKAVKNKSNYNTTGLYTLNYRLPDMNTAYGGKLDFFEVGNEAVKKFYGGKYPWTKT